MEELLLTGLGIYLLNRWGKKSPMNVGNIEPLDNTGNIVDRREIEDYEQKACPWFWYPWKRPAVFNKVPLSPGSRQRWLDMCELWLEIRKLGAEIKLLEAPIIDGTIKKRFIDDAKDQIKDKKNIQAFMLSETKRIANVQMRTEDLYKKVLKQNFDQDTINGFYAERKKEIQDRIWPKQNTTVVPIIEKKNQTSATALDPGANQGSITAMMGGYDRKKRMIVRTPNTIDLDRDAKREALPPGKRFTDAGTVYYEYRTNRTDYKGRI